eukprot:PhF_6_TR11521/c0_g2_i4/m.18450
MGCCPSSPKEKTNVVQQVLRPGTQNRNHLLAPHWTPTNAPQSLLDSCDKIAIFELFSTPSSNSTIELEKETTIQVIHTNYETMTTGSGSSDMRKGFTNVKADDLSSSTGTFTDLGSLTSQGVTVYQRVDVLITLQQSFPDLK